ncbi:MAG: hypothetical protein OXC98_09400 [bacterium]|nr:hypothetical protein [Acidimicrobiia bacterium]MCY4650565.1 hypothetical protein [bacterium]
MPRAFELEAAEAVYRVLRRILFARSAGEAHQLVIKQLGLLDRRVALCRAAAHYRRRSVSTARIGRVSLDSPLILAAGLVKGEGFATQEAALRAVREGRNIIPGWRSVPALVGPVEMGSFTPRPRLGNAGQVLWRDTGGRNLLNRVGLRNPGAAAAAAFLAERSDALPDIYGISIASDPDQADPSRRDADTAGAVRRFVEAGLRPSWTTVNISCPNVPQGYAHAALPEEVARLCRAVRDELAEETALWVKVGPDVGAGRYGPIAQAAVEGGAEAIVATNTAPGRLSDSGTGVGVGGACLHPRALRVVEELMVARAESGTMWEVVGCGGVLDGASYQAFRYRGAKAVQYWSALVFRGPTAPALILSEAARL